LQESPSLSTLLWQQFQLFLLVSSNSFVPSSVSDTNWMKMNLMTVARSKDYSTVGQGSAQEIGVLKAKSQTMTI